MVAGGGAFLGGAKGRLLPASVPFRFFGAAVVFHMLAWLALAAGAETWPAAPGAMGWPLASLHLLTLGVFGMTAMGAGAQLLPVATRQPAPGHRLLGALWWIYTGGVAVLASGMGFAQPRWLAVGAVAVSLAFLAWAALMLRNLLGARGMPGVVVHGWASLLALLVVLGSALSLAATWLGLDAPSRDAALAVHAIWAPYGFMGMLVLGLSYILVPMFAMADRPSERGQIASWSMALAALVLAAGAVFTPSAFPVRIAALVAGSAAAALHLRLMLRTLKTGMRGELGRSFTLVKIGWAGLAASLALAWAMVLELPVPRLATLFGLCLVGVWLLSLLMGMLQRIVPFLAAMHAGGSGRRARTPSSLTNEAALRVHFACHAGALALLGLAAMLDNAWLVRAAAAAGVVGAGAFALFFAAAMRRMRQPPNLS